MAAEQLAPCEREGLLDEVILHYLKAVDAGQTPLPAELLARHPELAEELRMFLADQERLIPWLAPLGVRLADAPGSWGEEPSPAGAELSGDTWAPPGMGRRPGGGPLPSVPGFEVLAELGQGGMGVVYQARDLALKRLVALKMLRPDRHVGAESLARLRAEAEALARLQHHHIVQVYSCGEHEGRPYIQQEFVEGGNLERQVHGQPQPPRDAARLVMLLARAVHAAHGCGIIHRDLKPANVLLAPPSGEPALNTAYGCPKVADFGLVKYLDSGREQTSPGIAVGTPTYMAPEQTGATGLPVGPATDVWALGAILYELLTGQVPFLAPSMLETLEQVCGRDPEPPRRLRPDVPAGLEAICLRCLKKAPGDRYPSAAALADDLTSWLNRRETNWLLVAGMLVCCLVLGWFGIARPLRSADEGATNLRLAGSPPADRLGQETPLFNGRDLEGWQFTSREYESGGVKKQARAEEVIRIVDGVLVCREEPRYWLFTRKRYSDFVLKLEYRFPGKVRWNTGGAVLLRMTQPGSPHDTYIPVRMGGWATGRIVRPFMGLPQSPEGYQAQPGLAGAERPSGEWNEYTVACGGDAIAVRVNGVLVNQESVGVVAREGAIGLAPQGWTVEFRNVRLTPIRE